MTRRNASIAACLSLSLASACTGPLVTERTDESGRTMLMRISASRDTAALKALIAKRADVNATVPARNLREPVNFLTQLPDVPRAQVGYTPLHFAVRARLLDNARILLASGADPKHVAADGSTALSIAVERGDVAMARLIARAGARANNRLLATAVARFSAGVVEVLLQHGGNPNARFPSMPSQPDPTPLLITAVRRGDPGVVRALLAARPNADARDRHGWSALRWAHDAKARRAPGAAEIVVLLDSAGARDDAGLKALSLVQAVTRKDVAAVRAALQAGADPNARNEHGVTPIIHASASRQAAIVSLLIQAGANVNARPHYSVTALTAAVENSDLDMATLLLAAGARVGLMDGRGMSPIVVASMRDNVDLTRALLADTTVRVPPRALSSAAGRGDTTLVRMLLDRGADAGDRQGWLLIIAARACPTGENAAVIRMLLDRGASVESRVGMSALHPAARSCGVEVTRLLVERGADVNDRDYAGMTPLMMAAGGDNLETVRFLLLAGAKVNAKDDGGFSALAYAKGAAVEQELLKAGARPVSRRPPTSASR